MEKITGIKAAYDAIPKFNDGRGLIVQINVDVETGEVVHTEHVSTDSWTVFKEPYILVGQYASKREAGGMFGLKEKVLLAIEKHKALEPREQA